MRHARLAVTLCAMTLCCAIKDRLLVVVISVSAKAMRPAVLTVCTQPAGLRLSPRNKFFGIIIAICVYPAVHGAALSEYCNLKVPQLRRLTVAPAAKSITCSSGEQPGGRGTSKTRGGKRGPGTGRALAFTKRSLLQIHRKVAEHLSLIKPL